jgi:putative peptidoglycan lipid II flippase
MAKETPKKPRSLVMNTVILGAWTLLSRGAGLARDVLMAGYLGTGAAADAFNVAFSLPNMFRRFFAEGAFNQAFVPIYAKKLEAGEDSARFASDAFSGLAFVLLIVTLIGTLAMPWLVWAMAAGFVGDERFDLSVGFGRITFVYLLFISLVALLSGVMNAHGRFSEAGFVPILMNLIFIAAIGLAVWLGWDIGQTLAWTVPVTGVAQLAFTWFAAHRIGFRLPLHWPRWTPDLKHLLITAGPAVLAGGVVQVNLLVGRQVASFTEGAVSWLVYADRLYQLPLGVVGIAVGTVLLPDLARRLRAGDEAGGQASLNRSLEFALALTLPAAVALVVIAHALIFVVYQRGAFGPASTDATALALAIYGAGLPAFVLQKVWQPLYYAREDTRRPFQFALLAMVVNGALAVGLMPYIGFAAAAVATTVAAWIMLAQLIWGARNLGIAVQLDARSRARLPRIVMASALMGGVLYGASILLAPWLYDFGWRYGALAGLIALGIVTYFGSGAAIGAFKLSDFRALKRGQ